MVTNNNNVCWPEIYMTSKINEDEPQIKYINTVLSNLLKNVLLTVPTFYSYVALILNVQWADNQHLFFKES